MPILYGANSHEGSFVYGSKIFTKKNQDQHTLTNVMIQLSNFYNTNTYFLPVLVVYKDFILAANKSDDSDFLKFEFVDTLLRAVGIEQEYAFSDQIRDKYFHEEQIGNLTAMTPGAIDVSKK